METLLQEATAVQKKPKVKYEPGTEISRINGVAFLTCDLHAAGLHDMRDILAFRDLCFATGAICTSDSIRREVARAIGFFDEEA